MVTFGVWDIFYYAWLWVILGWPPSLPTLDILFLIPIAWVGPVWAPCLVSVGLIGASAAVALRVDRGNEFTLGAWGGRPSSSRPFSLSSLSSGWDRRSCEGRCREHFHGPFSRRVWLLAWGVLRGLGGGARFHEKLEVREEKVFYDEELYRRERVFIERSFFY